ncbi:hypothetical protein JVT61DRAFT_14283 [Boletus reticuloceps]|uniref:Uncharacterized protein n=1 Tax=Boletus reticuloceps TaxID=495285 RepID=A0A8I2YCV8_9AGAM|nr:hypothetical protein JVT61DRAFT_14283 [Boletus reticuloceps]
MSHSITTSASYMLNKYSRSYPSSLQGIQAPVESEWQHFTNPPMRIILEAKKSPSGQLVSMRLKILWNVHTEADDLHIEQREVVFEDLELLSFSSLPTFQASATLQSDQGLPLKAVYRDAVVGIRYLHPRTVPPGSQPTYRRFQITLKNAQDASQFIDAIKPVCPCKGNPQPSHINRQSTMLSTSLVRAATTVSGHVPVQSAIMTERQSTIDPRPVTSTTLGCPPENQAFFVIPSSAATSLSSDDSAFVTCSETSHRADTQMDRHRKDELPKSRGRGSGQSSLPSSSQPSASSDQSISMPPPPVPRHATHSADALTQGPSGTVTTGDERSQFLAHLSKHPSLCELSRAELGTLVGQVIREEGFLQLLENLDSLWREKGFLGHR